MEEVRAGHHGPSAAELAVNEDDDITDLHEEEVDDDSEKENRRQQLVAKYGSRILAVHPYNVNQAFHPDIEQFYLDFPDRTSQNAAYNVASYEWEDAHPDWRKQQQEKKTNEAQRMEALSFAYQNLRHPDRPDFPTVDAYEWAVFEWEAQHSEWLEKHPWVRLPKSNSDERVEEKDGDEQ